MKGVSGRFFLVFLLLFSFSFLPTNSFSEDIPLSLTHKILLIHSYHQEYAWVQAITEGVKAGLKGRSVVLEIFYMDTKRYTSQKWMAEKGKKAREKIEEFKPDVVITADDNAQAFVARHYLNKRPFFVFCGVNGKPEDYGFPADNISGILERLFVGQSLELLKKIVPFVKTVSVISDSGNTSVGALTYVRENIHGVIVSDYKIVDDFSLWKKRILEFHHKVDALIVYTYYTIKEVPDAMSLESGKVMEWFRANVTIPSVGLSSSSVRDGALCGVVESGYEQGYEAAEMALRIIDGVKPAAIPIRTAKKGTSMVNLKTARALGITIPENILKSIDVVIDEK